MDTAKRVVGAPYTVCLLSWVAKLETSHVLQSNKNKTYRGRWERLSVSIPNWINVENVASKCTFKMWRTSNIMF